MPRFMKVIFQAVLILSILLVNIGEGATQSYPTAQLEPTNYEPLIGEPFNMTLTVLTEPNYEVVFPDFESDNNWGGLTVLDVAIPEVVVNDVDWQHTLVFTVVAWQVGEVTTPRTEIRYRAGNSGEYTDLLITPAFVIVPSTLDDLPSLRISRLVSDMRLISSSVITVVVVATVLLVLSAIWWLMPQRRQSLSISRTVAQRTLQNLQRLRFNAPDAVTLYAAVGDNLRQYVTTMLDIQEPDMTTSELMHWLEEWNGLHASRLAELEFILEQADLAKFAPKEILSNADPDFTEAARRWVKAVDSQLKLNER